MSKIPILAHNLLNAMKQLTILAIAALAFSCSKDKLDFDMLQDIRIQPEVEAPLINAKLSLADLEERDTNIVADPDNALRIKYSKDSLFYISAVEFVEIPEQNPFSISLSQSSPQLDTDIQLGTLGGVELNQATIDIGSFVIELVSPSTFVTDVNVEVILKNAIQNGSAITKTVVLPAGSTSVKDSVDLANVVFDFTGGQQKVNYIGMSMELLNPASVTPGTSIEVITQFKRLGLDEASGFFGQRNIQIPGNSINFDISGLDDFVNGFYFTDPKLMLNSTSTLGADLSMELDLDGINSDGGVVSLNAGQQPIAGADNPNSPKQNSITFDKNNSNIADFLANIPSEILYAGKVELNPSGATNNFITKNSGIKVGLDVDVPLKLTADNIKLDKIINDVDFFSENPEEVEALTLIFYTDNGFPFDMFVDVQFLEIGTGDSLQGFQLPLLNAAPVDASGRVISHAPGERLEITFTSEMLDRIKNSDKIRFVGSISTANNGNQVAALYTDYELGIRIAAKVKLNVKLNDE